MMPFALVTNLVIRWRHFSQRQICDISKNLICISFKYASSDLLQIGSKFGQPLGSTTTTIDVRMVIVAKKFRKQTPQKVAILRRH